MNKLQIHKNIYHHRKCKSNNNNLKKINRKNQRNQKQIDLNIQEDKNKFNMQNI